MIRVVALSNLQGYGEMNKQYLVQENSSGDLYVVSCTDRNDDVYKLFGREVYGMKGDFDTGNVDINVVEIPRVLKGQVVKLEAFP